MDAGHTLHLQAARASAPSPAPIHGPLLELERVLARTLADDAVVPGKCRALVLRGKRLRARLLLASTSSGRPATYGEAVRTAAVIELVHAASLLHDDIVDRCEQRRGLPTVHRVLGPRAATRDGMYLVHVALALLADMSRVIRTRFADAGQQLARGQFEEIVRAYDTTLVPEERLHIMERKTASVFGLACEIGGILSGEDPKDCHRRRCFGGTFGMLFQIADDVDDILGTEVALGRAPGSDLRGGIVSLPLAFALQTDAKAEIAEMLEEMPDGGTPAAIKRCGSVLRQCGALSRVCEIAVVHASAARGHLDVLPPSDGASWMHSIVDATLGRIVAHLEA